MKKTLLSVLAGLTVMGSVSAAPTPEDRKAMCEKHPDKYVWVEKTKACIPINPCESNDVEIKKSYCDDRTFANISLGYGAAIQVVDIPSIYRVACWGGSSTGNPINVRYPEPGPNYVAVQDFGEGTYKVYKFANILHSGEARESSALEFLSAVCNGIGGADTGQTYYNDNGFASIDCKSSCQKVYKTLEQVMDFMFDFNIDYSNNQITISFKSEQACYSYRDCMNK